MVQSTMIHGSKGHDQRTHLLLADIEDMKGIELMGRSEEKVDAPATKRMYRGQSIEDTPVSAGIVDNRPKRIYRGQVVA